MTKGYSIGSAAMACFLLFGAFMDEFSQYTRQPFTVINLATPEVLMSGLLGTMMIFMITGECFCFFLFFVTGVFLFQRYVFLLYCARIEYH
jgi:Na+/H+-translocating membrane pyrophosphatase